ncbi:hypothetical protein HGRIS_001796 [Hohenbuehelia grisea]|uniref:CID domain-containing protein n=1 Tax=Hohenbuehelia grisea TaxID=104357 RepID=A0ABR3JIP8_9AGAR
MDPFEVRMQFLSILRRLNATQQSIQKVVGFAIKYFPPCGEDLWDCIVEECQKGSIHARINILYFLDSLCETCLLVKSHSSSLGYDSNAPSTSSKTLNINGYVDYVTRDLGKIVDYVVPEGRQGLLNLTSTKQILENWRKKRVIDPQRVEDVISHLDHRTSEFASSIDPAAQSQSESRSSADVLPRGEVFKRVEEDRERHKRLRERRWVQPIAFNTPPLASLLPLDDLEPLHRGAAAEKSVVLPIDVEFENDWETTSDWNEDDDEAALEENELCFPAEGEGPMDLS